MTINLRGPLEQIRAAELILKLHRNFTWGPTMVATTAFLYGREYGRWQCGAIERIDLPDPDECGALVKDRPDLREQLDQVRQISADGVKTVAEWLKYAIGQAHAAEVLSQWEGFGRFCQTHLGIEPLVLMSAYRLITADPAEEVLASYPDAVVDEAIAEHWAGNWTREWKRRFLKG